MNRYLVSLMAAALMIPVAAPGLNAQTFSSFLEAGGAWLGIGMEDLVDGSGSRPGLDLQRGVVVRSVSNGSPAERAGIREGDVIVEYGPFPVWSASQLSRLVRETPIGRQVDLVILRAGKKMTLTATLAERGGALSDSLGNRAQPGMERRQFLFRMPEGRRGDSEPAPAGKPRLGVTLQPLTEQLAEFLGVPGKKGALVSSVIPGTASDGRLRAGDVIVSADGREIAGPEELTRVVSGAPAGEMRLGIIRDKKESVITVDLSADPDSKGYRL
ncbi:MAG: PDZ domain-containing protein [Acidobacteriota bacterium]|mgnify:CR=1 FL=1|jgi:serine protease Do|nr:PDZ domain-containing protein [Acidobacteriota bacterium]NLT34020.1 PDZ domain-containing protein [Acidobacteriota bacterium]